VLTQRVTPNSPISTILFVYIKPAGNDKKLHMHKKIPTRCDELATNMTREDKKERK